VDLENRSQAIPHAIQHRFHVKQHLSNVGKAIYGPTSKQAKGWMPARHHQLDCSQFPQLLRALRNLTEKPSLLVPRFKSL